LCKDVTCCNDQHYPDEEGVTYCGGFSSGHPGIYEIVKMLYDWLKTAFLK
jgi:hypothetical protein